MCAEERFLTLLRHLCSCPLLLKYGLLFFQVRAHGALRTFCLHKLLLERVAFQLLLAGDRLPGEGKCALTHLGGVLLAIGCLVLRFLGERGRLLRSLPVEIGGSEHLTKCQREIKLTLFHRSLLLLYHLTFSSILFQRKTRQGAGNGSFCDSYALLLVWRVTCIHVHIVLKTCCLTRSLKLIVELLLDNAGGLHVLLGPMLVHTRLVLLALHLDVRKLLSSCRGVLAWLLGLLFHLITLKGNL